MVKQFFRFSVVGVAGACVHYPVLWGLVVLGMMPVPASAIGFVMGAILSYVLNYVYTFKSQQDHRKTLRKFVLVTLMGLVLNVIFMAIFTHVFLIYYLYAQLMTMALVLCWNYAGNRMWAFREAP